MADSAYKPTIPPMVRTVVYAAGLIWGFLATIAVGGAAIWWPDHATAILGSVGAVSSGFTFLTGALGVAFRPTRPEPIQPEVGGLTAEG